MKTLTELKGGADEIQSFLQIDVTNNPEEIIERISKLMVYMALSGEMLSDAKKILRAKKTEQINQTIIKIAKESCLSASVQNALLDSICSEESHLVDYLERINKSATHQLDACRSLLSYEKEGMRINKTGY